MDPRGGPGEGPSEMTKAPARSRVRRAGARSAANRLAFVRAASCGLPVERESSRKASERPLGAAPRSPARHEPQAYLGDATSRLGPV